MSNGLCWPIYPLQIHQRIISIIALIEFPSVPVFNIGMFGNAFIHGNYWWQILSYSSSLETIWDSCVLTFSKPKIRIKGLASVYILENLTSPEKFSIRSCKPVCQHSSCTIQRKALVKKFPHLAMKIHFHCSSYFWYDPMLLKSLQIIPAPPLPPPPNKCPCLKSCSQHWEWIFPSKHCTELLALVLCTYSVSNNRSPAAAAAIVLNLLPSYIYAL